ncbi:hypothetical protein WMF04_11100 [Sorangium sp. So ce260]|uniref:hypothetical protein n=1 Tax=Sorangium sp. So ce260 TaxID=3133291 RepID=UPI003F62270A
MLSALGDVNFVELDPADGGAGGARAPPTPRAVKVKCVAKRVLNPNRTTPRQQLHRVEAGRWRAARLRQRVDASGGLDVRPKLAH